MENLIPFLKYSSVVDWFFIILVVFIAVILIPVGLWIVIASRRRKSIYFLLMMTFLPLLLALLGTYVRIRKIETLAARYPDASAEVVAAGSREAWVMTYIGAFGTLAPALIAVTGLVVKNNRLD
jgi:hypothetical protein